MARITGAQPWRRAEGDRPLERRLRVPFSDALRLPQIIRRCDTALGIAQPPRECARATAGPAQAGKTLGSRTSHDGTEHCPTADAQRVGQSAAQIHTLASITGGLTWAALRVGRLRESRARWVGRGPRGTARDPHPQAAKPRAPAAEALVQQRAALEGRADTGSRRCGPRPSRWPPRQGRLAPDQRAPRGHPWALSGRRAQGPPVRSLAHRPHGHLHVRRRIGPRPCQPPTSPHGPPFFSTQPPLRGQVCASILVRHDAAVPAGCARSASRALKRLRYGAGC